MSKLQKMCNMLKESKKFDTIQRLHNNHLYKSQKKQRKNNFLMNHSKNSLYYSAVYLSPNRNDSDKNSKSRVEKRNKSASEKKNNYFLTPLITVREQRHIYFENIKKVSEIFTKSITNSVRFNEVHLDKEDIERYMTSDAKYESNPFRIKVKKMTENVAVAKPKKEKKISEVRIIRKVRKTQQYNQRTQSPQNGFTLCGWQTPQQQIM